MVFSFLTKRIVTRNSPYLPLLLSFINSKNISTKKTHKKIINKNFINSINSINTQ
jgi:hypothetical protein